MTNRHLKHFYCLLITCSVLFFRCSSEKIAGGGTEDVNTRVVIGKVLNPDGSAAAQAQVRLIPSNYDPVKDSTTVLLKDTTNASGEYHFVLKESGKFTAQIIQNNKQTRAMLSRKEVWDDTTVFPSVVLFNPGRIRITVPRDVNVEKGYVYIPGTDVFTYLKDGSDYVVLDSVPADTIPDIAYSTLSKPESTILRHDVVVNPDETATVSNPEWVYSRTLFLNTSKSGADVNGTVTDFPILIRLTVQNFRFDQASSYGKDIRFAKSDTAFLPYEIERWDSAAQQAEIWVEVDTIRGNDSTQSITMYWGNPDAEPHSEGAAVFDIIKGFTGVWHLGEEGNSIFYDATANHYDGTPSDTAPQITDGIVGRCQSFDGVSNFIRMNGTADGKLNFQENSTYSISAWVYIETIDNTSHLIVGKSNEQYFLKFKPSVQDDPMVWEFVDFHDKTGWNITNSLPVVPSEKSWVYLTGVRAGTAQYLYLNGVLIDSSITVSSAVASKYDGDDLTIGKFLSLPANSSEGLCPFKGNIDEVRISSLAYSADWIKLCFMNQKEQDVLVKW